MSSLLIILLQDLNPGRGTFGRPNDSTSGLSEKGQMIIIFLIHSIWTLPWIKSLV